MPGVLSGFLLAFTMSLDDFIITHFTKGAGINTLSTLIYSEVRRGIRPSMYALSSIIFLTVLILLIFVNFRSIKNRKKHNRIQTLKENDYEKENGNYPCCRIHGSPVRRPFNRLRQVRFLTRRRKQGKTTS